jgi:hypothetical protein
MEEDIAKFYDCKFAPWSHWIECWYELWSCSWSSRAIDRNCNNMKRHQGWKEQQHNKI